MCSHDESLSWAEELRMRLTYALIDAGRAGDLPRFVYMIRDTVPARELPTVVERITFHPNRRSKWRAQKGLLREPPAAVVVFDQHNDFPLIRSRANIHIDRRRAGVAQVEEDGLRLRARFMARWAVTALRCLLHTLRIRPYTRTGKYG
jgi:hypothetical protein